MAKQPFRGQELGGLGEHVGDPRRYDVEPKSVDLSQAGYPGQPLGPGPGSGRKVIENENWLYHIRSLVAPDNIAKIRAVQLGSTTPIQLDDGISNRTGILIANMSDQVVWIGSNSNGLGANRGYPLSASSPAGSFNGGTLAMDLSEKTHFWGIAAAGTSNLVVVIESAR